MNYRQKQRQYSLSKNTFDSLLGNVFAHVVFDSSSGKDNLRMIAELLRPVRQIVRGDAHAGCRPPRLPISFPI